ncbi:MAG: AAA family ATPase [Oscillospiraceae bacterium]|jgi:DNA helicase-2/ATP-dependent DNA helicase PcrA|nr:AAA family ATPase [Oscillospiraceae bacterium]
MNNETRAAEEQYLKAVIAQVERELADTEAAIDSKTELIRGLTGEMWDSMPHAVRSFDDAVELSGQNQEIDIRASLRSGDLARRRVLRAMLASPYFGRIDLIFEGEHEPFSVYVGRGSVGTGADQLVYDWRAPISSVFYEFPLGECSYTSPNGKINARLTAKRQYKIIGGELIYAVDTDMKIDDELLLEALNSPSNSRLKAIINSIQREQFDAIRRGASRSILVTGPAGSGKTSVGTHRLAYLLYNDRRLKSENTVIISHNGFFSEYISEIIPELGESDVGHATFYSLIRRYIPSGFAITGWCDLAEELLSDDGTIARELDIKYSKAFSDYIERRVPALTFDFRDIKLAGDLLLSGETLRSRWEASAAGPGFKTRRESLTEFTRDTLRYELGQRDYKFYNKVNPEYDFDKVQFIKEFCDREAGRIHNTLTVSPAELYPRLLRDYLSENDLPQEIARSTSGRLGRGIARFDDAVLIAFTARCLGELRPRLLVAHVLLDEAQDNCRLQHIILRELFPKSAFTLLADAGQSIVPPQVGSSEAEIAELYGAEHVLLNKSYRSTLRINALASALLGAEYEYMSREGVIPAVHLASDVPAALRALFIEKLKEHNSVCVLTRSIRDAVLIYDALDAEGFPDPDARPVLVADTDSAPPPRAVVVPLALAKGMEFDCVIIPASNDGDFPLRRGSVGYTMATRALHELHIVAPPGAMKTAPEFIPDLCEVIE